MFFGIKRHYTPNFFKTKYSSQEYYQRHGRKQLLYLSTKKEIPTIPETTEESVSPVVLEKSSHQF